MRQVDEKWNHMADESSLGKCSPFEEVMRTTRKPHRFHMVIMWVWLVALGYFVVLIGKAIEQVWRDL